MEHRLAFGLINGYLNHPLWKWSLYQVIPLNFPELVTSGKQIWWGKFFSCPNVQFILSIPLSSCLPWDRLVSVYTPKGKFTICSAYNNALEEAMNSKVDEPSNSDTHWKFWRNIWSLNMPNKVKSFAWKACWNMLPTKANLCRIYVKLVDWVLNLVDIFFGNALSGISLAYVV